ncbi:MAG TPA: hypothetical protein VE621_09455 [Bryobacteraceae bacterium]|nr:hypothetical protein [Bryobacteraceae bacterium]
MPERWCTVTVTDSEGRRFSLDVRATSTFDAAHLYVVQAKTQPASGLPVPSLATIFEVVIEGRIYRVHGAALQRWITLRQREWNGPKGVLFRQRPGL